MVPPEFIFLFTQELLRRYPSHFIIIKNDMILIFVMLTQKTFSRFRRIKKS